MELERVKDNRDGTFTFLFDEVTSKYSSRQKPLTFTKNGECWECVSHHTNNSGHCQFERNGKSILVHRYVYEHTKGKIPDGLLVRHTCDNPKCINPDHCCWERTKIIVETCLREAEIIAPKVQETLIVY